VARSFINGGFSQSLVGHVAIILNPTKNLVSCESKLEPKVTFVSKQTVPGLVNTNDSSGINVKDGISSGISQLK
jgi:hypothetical protein